MASVHTPAAIETSTVGESPRFNCLADWLGWQEGLHFTAIDLGLDRVRLVAEKMGLLTPGFAVISVAGTNGKGSSVTMLEMILHRSGYRTGKYTSPHLLRYNERICLSAKSVADELICAAFDRVDRAREDVSLTYFEFGTLAALDIFRRSGVEVAILEVGLGGRLDAVNILDADASLVTSIDIDHENWLGSDRESIGAEKAGIFRPGTAAVCSDPKPPQSIIAHARAIDADLKLLGPDYQYVINENSWNWQSAGREYTGLAKPSIYDDCQIQNAAGVLKLLDTIRNRFPASDDAITSTFQDFRLEGRFQVIPSIVPYILDVAHNCQSSGMLAENLRKLPSNGSTHCILGMLKDKNHQPVFRALNPVVDSWYLVDLDSERAEPATRLAKTLASADSSADLQVREDVVSALQFLETHARPGDRIVITGSFLTVRDALLYLSPESA